MGHSEKKRLKLSKSQKQKIEKYHSKD